MGGWVSSDKWGSIHHNFFDSTEQAILILGIGLVIWAGINLIYIWRNRNANDSELG